MAYVVWMFGSRSTSSLNVYLIFLYISSPILEKSTETSGGAGLSRPTCASRAGSDRSIRGREGQGEGWTKGSLINGTNHSSRLESAHITYLKDSLFRYIV